MLSAEDLDGDDSRRENLKEADSMDAFDAMADICISASYMILPYGGNAC